MYKCFLKLESLIIPINCTLTTNTRYNSQKLSKNHKHHLVKQHLSSFLNWLVCSFIFTVTYDQNYFVLVNFYKFYINGGIYDIHWNANCIVYQFLREYKISYYISMLYNTLHIQHHESIIIMSNLKLIIIQYVLHNLWKTKSLRCRSYILKSCFSRVKGRGDLATDGAGAISYASAASTLSASLPVHPSTLIHPTHL